MKFYTTVKQQNAHFAFRASCRTGLQANSPGFIETLQICTRLTTSEDNCQNAEKWGLSWLKQHNFVIFIYILTKLGDKVYILSFNSCVKFHAKICTYCWSM